MKLREVGVTPVDEVVAFALERLPMLDEGLARTTLDPQIVSCRHYIEVRDDSGALAGFAYTVKPESVPDTWRFTVVVCRRDLGGQGLGGRLWSALRSSLDDQAELLYTFVMDGDDPASATAARSWGFTVVQHSVTSELLLTGLAPVSTDLGDGVVLEACDDLVFDDDDGVAAMLLASQTNPEAAVGLVMTLESLRKPPAEGQRRMAVLARVDGHPAAITLAAVSGDELHVHYTGVDPSWRGRGLARRTKELLHARAARSGTRIAITDNEDGNVGIRHVNEQLGYRARSGVSWMTAPARVGGSGT